MTNKIIRVFKNKNTGQILKLSKSDNPNWKWNCSDPEYQEIFIELVCKKGGIEKELKQNWKLQND